MAKAIKKIETKEEFVARLTKEGRDKKTIEDLTTLLFDYTVEQQIQYFKNHKKITFKNGFKDAAWKQKTMLSQASLCL